jgi:hypothetical protein
MTVGIGRQNIIILFWKVEITVSFLGIHKWEPDIYIGFSPALHCSAPSSFYQLAHTSSNKPLADKN